jgi:hypothetical protein
MTKARDLADRTAADLTAVTAGTGISISDGAGPIPTVTNTVATGFDAKGDLIVGTGADTFNRLATGSNGDTLVADSATTTGLAWSANFAAGKNKIFNGDMNINQRAFTSETTNNAFTFDRWRCGVVGNGTTTFTPQTFTPGTAPVAGYEAQNFLRIVTTGQTQTDSLSQISQRIEDVRTLANQTVTVSFWAKAASGTPKIATNIGQNFGSGGSSTVTKPGQSVTISTSWARYSFTFSLDSISGKTVGTSSYLTIPIIVSAGSDRNTASDSLGIQSNTFDIWGLQLEAGSVATAFQTATGNLASELAACQRYYVREYAATTFAAFAQGNANSGTQNYVVYKLPVTMRTAPSAVEFATLQCGRFGGSAQNVSAVVIAEKTTDQVLLEVTSGNHSLTAGAFVNMGASNSTSAYIGFTAEL